MDPKSPAFRRLQAEWYGRLAREGFRDIEVDGEFGALARPHHEVRRTARRSDETLRSEYYRRAAQWLWEAVWESRLAKRCWELHSEGVSHLDTVGRLGTHRGYSPRLVLARLRRARTAMMQWLGGLEDSDDSERSAFDVELAGFDWVTNHGEGRGQRAGGSE